MLVLQERSWPRGMNSTPWLRQLETDSSGTELYPKSKVINDQAPLKTGSFGFPSTKFGTSPLYSSNSSSLLQKNTVASIEEMERQLHILDEEVKAGVLRYIREC